MSYASVMRQVGDLESGYNRRGALIMAFFMVMKAARVELSKLMSETWPLLRTGEHI